MSALFRGTIWYMRAPPIPVATNRPRSTSGSSDRLGVVGASASSASRGGVIIGRGPVAATGAGRVAGGFGGGTGAGFGAIGAVQTGTGFGGGTGAVRVGVGADFAGVTGAVRAVGGVGAGVGAATVKLLPHFGQSIVRPTGNPGSDVNGIRHPGQWVFGMSTAELRRDENSRSYQFTTGR